MNAIALKIVKGALRRINRDLVKVRSAQTAQLGVKIGKESSLQQRILRRVDPRHNMTRAKSYLFSFGEEIVRVAVENHFPDHLQWYKFFWNELRCMSTSNSNRSATSSSKICRPSSNSGKSPAAIASQRSRRWKSGSAPLILTASSHNTELVNVWRLSDKL
jgi:hypothetical protein